MGRKLFEKRFPPHTLPSKTFNKRAQWALFGLTKGNLCGKIIQFAGGGIAMVRSTSVSKAKPYGSRRIRFRIANIKFNMRAWRNWQTHKIQDLTPFGVQVQVLSPAPKSKGISNAYPFLIFVQVNRRRTSQMRRHLIALRSIHFNISISFYAKRGS